MPLPFSCVKQDDLKALKFYQKACDLNNGSGCSNLGVMHEKGKGVKQFNAFAFFIHNSKIKATTARIQITRLLEKLERLEIILFNNKMISRRSSFTKRRVI
jgi:hypothetical protein